MNPRAIAHLACLTLALSAGCDDTALPGRAAPAVDAAGQPQPPDPIVQVAAGRAGHCLRSASGRVTCSDGLEVVSRGARALAAGGTFVWHEELLACALVGPRVACASQLRRYQLEPAATPVALSIGDHLGCLLDARGGIACFDPMSDDPNPALTPGPLVPGARALSCGYLDCCALDAAGRVRCWGAPERALPAVPDLGQPAVAISAGAFHVCAILADRSVTCWGIPDVPAPSPAVAHARAIDAGYGNTCAVGDDARQVVCDGFDGPSTHDYPADVVALDVDAEVCVLLADGAVVCD